MDHDTEIPGAGPTRILSLEEGDAVDLPPEVDTEFRRLQPRRPSKVSRDDLLQIFRDDLTGTTDKPGCVGDWAMLHPHLADEFAAIGEEVVFGRRRLPPEPSLMSPNPSPPIFVAVLVCVGAIVLVECVLVALRVGHAIDWDWGWVLASLLLPTAIATIFVILTAIALAAMDERDAARRRVL